MICCLSNICAVSQIFVSHIEHNVLSLSIGICKCFCYFNNISVSLLKLFNQEKIKSAFVLDFDLHTGDGNMNILESRNDLHTKICNPIAE